MRVTEVAACRNGKDYELSARIETIRQNRRFRLNYRISPGLEDLIEHSGDPFIPACLLPSMSLNEPLIVDAPISPKLNAELPNIMSIYHSWNPKFRPITVNAPLLHGSASGLRKTKAKGLFFSLGLDSFYSLVKLNQDLNKSPSHLIFISGFDIPLRNLRVFTRAHSSLKDVANSLGKQIIVVSTNLKEIADQFTAWEMFHGAALASIGLALAGVCGRIYIAATHSKEELFGWGSHPDLDPLWSTETTSFVHYGEEKNRIQKALYLSDYDLARKHLRVCYQDWNNEYNCCRCGKCVRTMLELYLAGVLPKFRAFPVPLTAKLVREVTQTTGSTFANSTLSGTVLAELQNRGERELATAFQMARRRGLLYRHLPNAYIRLNNYVYVTMKNSDRNAILVWKGFDHLVDAAFSLLAAPFDNRRRRQSSTHHP